MTRKQFEKLRAEIEKEKFHSLSVHPLNYGIERLEFEKRKLHQLIKMAKDVPGLTVEARAARWQRKLVRLEKSMERFKCLQQEAARAKTTAFITLAAHAPARFAAGQSRRID